jgi:hypothetical protein
VVSAVRVFGVRFRAGLDPEERPVEASVALCAEELAVEIDADLKNA